MQNALGFAGSPAADATHDPFQGFHYGLGLGLLTIRSATNLFFGEPALPKRLNLS